MNAKELLTRIESNGADEIFSDLYGEREIDSARRRYKALIAGIIESGEADAEGNLRVFSAPGRTELGGNHTDHNRGKVIAASIQLDNAAVVQERKDNTVFFRSARYPDGTGFPDVKIKLVDASGMPDLKPKSEEEGKTESLVRGIAAELNNRGCAAGGFSANAVSGVLPGSGLSSSAALEVLLCRIFDSLYGEGKRSSLEIAQIGQIAENAYFGKPCGLMDQIACAAGGAVAIDFAQDIQSDAGDPQVKQINFNPEEAGYAFCVVNTGGSHSDLTSDYAAIPAEMKSVAAFFGKSVLRELDKETVLSRAAEVRKSLGDRALLRALHFFNENARVDHMFDALARMDRSAAGADKERALSQYLDYVNESGASSWELLQNVFSRPDEQGIAAALALTREFFLKQNLQAACRVHGGGFAGTIQVYLPVDAVAAYRAFIEAVFGSGSLAQLKIRPLGAVELFFE